MKNIHIQDKANIKGNGIHTFPNAKPVVCIETGEVFTSVLDAAAAAGVTDSSMVCHLKGRVKTCKGKHYCYLSKTNENLDAIVTRLRETSAMEEDARKWRAYQAEQEAIRKAEEDRIEAERKAKEKYEADVARARNKVVRRQTICERLKAQLTEAEKRRVDAEIELEALEYHAKEMESNDVQDPTNLWAC